jgi:hypothetical protein
MPLVPSFTKLERAVGYLVQPQEPATRYLHLALVAYDLEQITEGEFAAHLGVDIVTARLIFQAYGLGRTSR